MYSLGVGLGGGKESSAECKGEVRRAAQLPIGLVFNSARTRDPVPTGILV